MDALVECKRSVRAVDDAYMESGIKAESWQIFRSTDTTQDATCFKARCRHASECALNFQKVVSVYHQYHRPRNTQMGKWKTLEWAHPWRHSFPADWSVHHTVSMAMTLCAFWKVLCISTILRNFSFLCSVNIELYLSTADTIDWTAQKRKWNLHP